MLNSLKVLRSAMQTAEGRQVAILGFGKGFVKGAVAGTTIVGAAVLCKAAAVGAVGTIAVCFTAGAVGALAGEKAGDLYELAMQDRIIASIEKFDAMVIANSKTV